MRNKVAKKLAKIGGVPKQTAVEIRNFVCRPTLDKNGDVRLVRVRPRSHREKGRLNVEAEILRLDEVTKQLVADVKRKAKAEKEARARSRVAAANRVKKLRKTT